ncbi:MAG: hypothetical protein ACI9FG_001095 [Crocinitomicaceae bacterium]|jgi:hypothetical protein
MVLAPLPRLALMDQKITPGLVFFDSLSGIIPTHSHYKKRRLHDSGRLFY